VGDEEACRELQWVEDNRRDIPHVIHGDDSRLCHGDDVPVFRDRRDSMGGSRSFFEVLWSCSAIDEGKELLDVVDPGVRRWSRMGSLYRLLREPQGFTAYGLNFLCSGTPGS
jgi:hypothetical protein